MSSSQNVLLTGASGFVASHILNGLVKVMSPQSLRINLSLNSATEVERVGWLYGDGSCQISCKSNGHPKTAS